MPVAELSSFLNINKLVHSFMYTEARKLSLIEEVLKISNESTLLALEQFVKNSKKENNIPAISAITEFSGIWSVQEANEIEQAIEMGCERINSNDWK